jgi:acetyl esterase/lipase
LLLHTLLFKAWWCSRWWWKEEAFRERLKRAGKACWWAQWWGSVPHGFDKVPTLRQGNVKRDEMYQDAIKEMEKMWQM